MQKPSFSLIIFIKEPLRIEYLFSSFNTTPLVNESPSAAIFTFFISSVFCFDGKITTGRENGEKTVIGTNVQLKNVIIQGLKCDFRDV